MTRFESFECYRGRQITVRNVDPRSNACQRLGSTLDAICLVPRSGEERFSARGGHKWLLSGCRLYLTLVQDLRGWNEMQNVFCATRIWVADVTESPPSELPPYADPSGS